MRAPGLLLAALAGAALAINASAAEAAPAAAQTTTRYAQVRRACSPPARGRASCLALVRVPVAPGAPVPAGARPYTLNDGAASGGPAGGLSPSELASAYDYSPEAGGSGQTVALVDAYNDPNIEKDLATFDTRYGLVACTSKNGCFTKVGQTGSTTSLPEAEAGWAVEISLDVESVHGVCPKCKILLVEATDESYESLADAVNEAVKLGATEVSNSYGGPESEQGPSERAAYNHPGVVISASTGDDGYNDWDYLSEFTSFPAMPDAPASLPSVVAVGGTSLELTTGGIRRRESVWNDSGPPPFEEEFKQFSATGGGCSTLFTAQPWQQDVASFAASGCGSGRLDADVSAVADPYTGFDIYDSYGGGGWETIGGTSLSSPLVTALYALAGGSNGVRYPGLTLYGHLAAKSSPPFDVTEGGDGYCDAKAGCHPDSTEGPVDCEGTTACDAAPGYDGPTGVGAPDGLEMFKPLLPAAAITPPTSLAEGIAAIFSAASSSDPYPGGSMSGYSWSWGDGTPGSSDVSPTHTYAAAGTYTVTLTVTDSYGLTSALSKQTVEVSKAKVAQSINFTSTAPSSASVGGATYNVTVAGGASGNPVALTIDAGSSSVCSISGSTVSFIGAGACTIDANQAGNANYDAAPQAQQSFAVSLASSPAPVTAPSTPSGTTAVLVSPLIGSLPSKESAVAPNSNFGAVSATFNASTGAITFKTSVSQPGTFSWLLTFRNGKLGVFAARTRKCKAGFVTLNGKCRPSKIAFAKGSVTVASAGAVSFAARPDASAAKALRNALEQRKGLLVAARLTFQSALGGSPTSRTESVTVSLEKK